MADERKYYVLCGDNCKFESMTKEQILAALEQAANLGKIVDVDAGFVSKIKEVNKGAGFRFWLGTQAEYNMIENPADDVFYIITDDAEKDELDAEIAEMSAAINAISTKLANTVDTYKKVLWKTTTDDVISSETINPEDSTTWRTIEGLNNYTIFAIQAVLAGSMIGIRNGNVIQAYSIQPGSTDGEADNSTGALRLWLDVDNNPNTICKVEGKYSFRNGLRLGRITGII